MTRMTASTSTSGWMERLSGLVDLERSRDFHGGRVVVDRGRMEALLAALPALPWPRVSVHVAGSEGKTSTTEFVAAGLGALGLRTATYTSPHLRDVRERLRVGGDWPPDGLLDRALSAVESAASRAGLAPTFFEFLTAAARVLYAEAGVDAVVWETGLGGRLDATRCMQVEACAITSISLEHTSILGTTLPAIAAEKAGILRPHAPVALGAGVPAAARTVIERRARQLGCPVASLPLAAATRDALDPAAENRALARLVLDQLAASGRVPPRTAAVDAAIDGHVVEGRWQRVGDVLFDGAHTVASMQRLAARLAREPVGAVVFGATSGRDVAAMLAPLEPLRRPLVLTGLPTERGVPTAELRAAVPAGLAAQAVAVDAPAAALDRARRLAGGGPIVVTGSLYLVGCLLDGATG